MDTQNEVLGGAYLSFNLGCEVFAAHANKVVGILEMTKITPVPKAPLYMVGIINLRGSILPIIDTRKVMGMPTVEYCATTSIIVVETYFAGESVQVGLIVDSVLAVHSIELAQVLPVPKVGVKYSNQFVDGVVSIDNEFVMLINIESLLASKSIDDLKGEKVIRAA
jgi:purine-binding chemotaxis protein CheW